MGIEKDLGAVSAYAIAVAHGFEGTEEEWLESLIGPMGYQGWSVSAVRATTTGQLIFTVTDPKTGETRELDPVQGDTIDALKEIEDAAEDAKNQVKEAANAASASAVKAVEGAQNAGVQAVKDTKTAAVEAITSAQTAGVQAVQGAQTTALNAITEAQTQATEAVGTAKTQAVQAVEDAENTGVSAVEDAKSNALTEVGKAKTTAVAAVNAAGTQAASDAQTAITTAKNQAVSDVQNAGQSAVGAVEEAQTAGVQAVEDAQINAVETVQDAGTAEIEKINDILPVPTAEDAGKVPVAKPDGTGYELGEAGVQIDDTKTTLDTTWSSQNIVSQLCAPFTTEGAIVTCQPVEGSQLNAVVQIEPVQEGEGDPSPENVRPIRGWDTVNVWRGGKNLLNPADLIKRTTSTASYTNCLTTTGAFTYRADKTYTFAAKTENTGAEGYLSARFGFAGSSQFIFDGSKKSFTTFFESDAQYQPLNSGETPILVKSDNEYPSGEISEIQLELGNSATDYEPYRGETFIIPLGQTVYGGTLDVTNGTLTITKRNFILTGTEPFTLYQTVGTINCFWYTQAYVNGMQDKIRTICNYYPSFSGSSSATGKVGVYQTGSTTNGILNINLLAAEVPDINAFNALMKSRYDAGKPVEVVAEIGTPLTVQLTPKEILALSGENTIYADAGNVTVSGHSDPNAIINSLADRIAALEHNAIGG